MVKLRPTVSMALNDVMSNVEVAHKLMLQASMNTSTGFNSQYYLAFKFIIVGVINTYRIFNLYKDVTQMIKRLTEVRNSSTNAFEMRKSVIQLRSPFHVF